MQCRGNIFRFLSRILTQPKRRFSSKKFIYTWIWHWQCCQDSQYLVVFLIWFQLLGLCYFRISAFFKKNKFLAPCGCREKLENMLILQQQKGNKKEPNIYFCLYLMIFKAQSMISELSGWQYFIVLYPRWSIFNTLALHVEKDLFKIMSAVSQLLRKRGRPDVSPRLQTKELEASTSTVLL